jgi:restriction endonuclease Mrr
MGGRGRREKVIEIVGKKMKDLFTPADFKKLPQSKYIRWENRVAWQASNMRSEGYIRNNSPRGIWEITDAGRKWVDGNIYPR